MPTPVAALDPNGPGPSGNVKATREDWLGAALETLIADGIEGVRVLTLGQRLGVSRSSFYWYFDSRQHLLDELLAHWRDKNTRAIVEHAGRPAATVTAAVLGIFECWVDERLFHPRLDFAIRAWSRSSPEVRAILDVADAERVAAIRDMFLRHGFEAQEAFVRARVLYFMQIGYYALELGETMARRLQLVPDYLVSFTGERPRPGEMEAFTRFVEAVAARA